MTLRQDSAAERFLNMYRTLEGLLEKRYVGHHMNGPSVVMEYLRDPDSASCRTELDLCREIRNILSHNVDEAGEAVVEPSPAILQTLQTILDHVQRPRLAVEYGTAQENIMFAHPNDVAMDVMHRMKRLGYSHVPVVDRTGLVGVFSPGSLFVYLEKNGFSGLDEDLRIGQLKTALSMEDGRSDRYLFLSPEATLPAVRQAFERRSERNARLAAVFITQDGTRNTPIISMLTPWDVLRDVNPTV